MNTFYYEDDEEYNDNMPVIVYSDDDDSTCNNTEGDNEGDNELASISEPSLDCSDDEFDDLDSNVYVLDNEDIFHFYEIGELEEEFLDSDKYDGQYVIGLSSGTTNMMSGNISNGIFACGVTPSTFFRYSYVALLYYLVYSSIFCITGPKKIDIIKIHVTPDSVYLAITKTYWLRIIQRHWKRALKERKTLITLRSNPRNVFHFQYHGKYPDGINYLPGLTGLLSCYNKNKDRDDSSIYQM
jgi:hypothetical protein